MTQSKQQVPHFYVSIEIDVSELTATLARQDRRPGADSRVTLTAYLLHALTRTLQEHRAFNAVWRDGQLMVREDINVSVAVAVDGGLVAPALLNADGLDVPGIASSLSDLVQRARSGRLRAREMSEGTFTLSNLGMFGVPRFTAIITPPQVGILAVGAAVERAVVQSGEIVIRSILEATLSSDHRAVDGADAARFLRSLKSRLEKTERA